ncbi:hypothetical protein RSOL_208430 [Rhizoctonia solani AG-3 Rhs1AP]|uniref:Uncharacterized protein n=2 Tax=Rhizoctonia solani AG-3 TaxID=1086053 RepID=A0A074S6Z8_9AGAM|nr:hypothetical protein RSOL_208430 [Rhizoctonia solani AG-3 Rhs1AP]KEP52638.1 hypothetical protein V565_042470 [Rhizoctonia solani 123E]
MAINTAHIVSHYAQPKPRGFQWSPRPLKLAKSYPVPLRARTSGAPSSPSDTSQPVVRIQNERQEESSPIEESTASDSGQPGEGQLEVTSSSDSTSPSSTKLEIVAEYMISPEDFLRNALPSTHAFSQSTPAVTPTNSRLDISPPYRLRPSSSMSNLSSGSNRSRPPSSMSFGGHTRRSSSRTSVRQGTASSLGATSS